MNATSNYAGLGDLVEQIKETSRSIEQSDSAFTKRLDGIEASVNELFHKTQRPAASARRSTTSDPSAGDYLKPRPS